LLESTGGKASASGLQESGSIEWNVFVEMYWTSGTIHRGVRGKPVLRSAGPPKVSLDRVRELALYTDRI
jgi:hypothetical protein